MSVSHRQVDRYRSPRRRYELAPGQRALEAGVYRCSICGLEKRFDAGETAGNCPVCGRGVRVWSKRPPEPQTTDKKGGSHDQSA